MDIITYALIKDIVQNSNGDGSSEGEANMQSDWNESNTTSDAYIKNKPAIPTKTSDLTNDSDFVQAETGTWTPTLANNINFTFRTARYYYNGYTVTVEVILDFSTENEAINYFAMGGLPIAISSNGGGVAGSGYIYNSANAPTVATFSSSPKRVTVRSSENLAGKSIAIGLTYII